MGPVTLGLAGVSAVGLAVVVLVLVRARRDAPDLDGFLDGLGYDDEDGTPAAPLVGRVLGGVSRSLSASVERVVPRSHLRDIDRQLAYAGLTGKRRAGEQVARQAALAVAGLGLARLVPVSSPTMSLAVLVLLPVMGFMVPSVLLKRRIESRSTAIFKDLPDIVDMLAIAVEAGSGFEAALSLICQNFKSPLTDELAMALHDMELGLPRKDALQRLRARVDVDAVRTLVLVLLQADALGIPIGRVLKSQATEVRSRRRAWAREKAAKLPVKIMFPMVLFIFPPILALVLGPAVGSFGKL